MIPYSIEHYMQDAGPYEAGDYHIVTNDLDEYVIDKEGEIWPYSETARRKLIPDWVHELKDKLQAERRR